MDSLGFVKLLGAIGFAATFVVLIGALFFGVVPMFDAAQNHDATAVDDLDVEELEYLVHAEVNQTRREHGRDRLVFDTDLREPAAYHSEQMAEEGFFAHESPDGETFRERYEMFEYTCDVKVDETTRSRGGENLAKTYYDRSVEISDGTITEYDTPDELAEGIVQGWMDSPDHRENMLTDHWNRQGIGIDIADDGAIYVTQNFC